MAIKLSTCQSGASHAALVLKSLPANVGGVGSIPGSGRSLGREDPLEEEVAITPVFFPGKFHGQKSLMG